MVLSESAKNDLIWWKENVTDLFKLISQSPSMIFLTTDISKQGWGAVYMDNISTGGRWLEGESEIWSTGICKYK